MIKLPKVFNMVFAGLIFKIICLPNTYQSQLIGNKSFINEKELAHPQFVNYD